MALTWNILTCSTSCVYLDLPWSCVYCTFCPFFASVVISSKIVGVFLILSRLWLFRTFVQCPVASFSDPVFSLLDACKSRPNNVLMELIGALRSWRISSLGRRTTDLLIPLFQQHPC